MTSIIADFTFRTPDLHHAASDLEYAETHPGELLSEIEGLKAERFALQEDLREANQRLTSIETYTVGCSCLGCRCGR